MSKPEKHSSEQGTGDENGGLIQGVWMTDDLVHDAQLRIRRADGRTDLVGWQEEREDDGDDPNDATRDP